MHSDDREEDPLEGEEAASTTGRRVAEAVRKAIISGMGSLLTTEEGLRSVMSELKMPKEAMGFLLNQAERTKADMGRALEREFSNFLHTVDVRRLVQRTLAGMVLEVTAEIRFRPEEDGELVPLVKVNKVSKTTTRTTRRRKTKRRSKE